MGVMCPASMQLHGCMAAVPLSKKSRAVAQNDCAGAHKPLHLLAHQLNISHSERLLIFSWFASRCSGLCAPAKVLATAEALPALLLLLPACVLAGSVQPLW